MILPWLAVLAWLGAPHASGPVFEAAEVCATCHSRLPAPPEAGPTSGRDSIAPHALWSGSMKAHATRDPYWRAKLREEQLGAPEGTHADIEDECLRCHAPAQQYPLRERGVPMRLDALDERGLEGVGCTVCHQIGPDGLGRLASFGGGFLISLTREIYGPHADPFPRPMWHHTPYTPVESRHVLEASLCGTCHTVLAPGHGKAAAASDPFVEQATYLEWLLSGHPAEGRTCQSCHVPSLVDSGGALVEQYIAHRPPGGPFPPTWPRAPFGQHHFVGGNVRGAEMLAELLPHEAATLQQTSERARRQLESALELRVDAEQRTETLHVRVETLNRTGHKLPTAYPSRRLWLHVLVRDAAGQALFESGRWDVEAGEIAGIGPGVPHLRHIREPEQVMVYEAALVDTKGRPTVSLLEAAGLSKDNRILPAGFDPRRSLPRGLPPSAVTPVGVKGDSDFRPGSDRVEYVVDLTDKTRPASLLVEAYYQSVAPGHLKGMRGREQPDIERFLDLYRRHAAPVLIARQERLFDGGRPVLVSRLGRLDHD